jgi:ribosome-associated protein
MKPKPTPARQLLKLCCRAREGKKAGDLRVLDVRELSSITDYMVLATGTSEPHLRALRMELERELDSDGVRLVGLETSREGGWTVVDAFDVMVHLFSPETRDRYGLENLWKDAVTIPVGDLLAVPRKRKAAPRTGKPKSRRRAG